MSQPDLRHRITVQSKSTTQSPTTGYETTSWVNRLADEPAEWMEGPGREYLAAEALRAQITGRFTLRWSTTSAAITAGDRVTWDGRTMKVLAPPQVDKTARRWVTLMVAEDGTDGA